MAEVAQRSEPKKLSDFFSLADARVDRWRSLLRVARRSRAKSRVTRASSQQASALLAELAPLEELCAYPGPRLLAQVHERMKNGDWAGVARLVQRISAALLDNSYRDSIEAWRSDDDAERSVEILPPTLGRAAARKPYFEVLVVVPGARSLLAGPTAAWRRLRRDEDQYIYEVVVTGTLEDAVLATLFNYNLQAIVIYDGFAVQSSDADQVLRDILEPYMSRVDPSSRGRTSARRSSGWCTGSGPSWTSIC